MSTEPQPPGRSETDPVEDLLDRAHSSLGNVSLGPFSSAGFARLRNTIDEFIADLVVESARVMRRRQADTISAEFVDQASTSLVQGGRRRRRQIMGTLGGVFLGGALSAILGMIQRRDSTLAEAIFAVIAVGLGVLLIAVQFER